MSRVQDQWAPHMNNLFFAPGEIFHQNVDILTRYQPNIAAKITNEFYSPSWMKKEIPDRVTVNVASMRKQSEESLPHLCAQQQIWALMKNSNPGANKLTKQPASNQAVKGSLHSTGSWGLQRKRNVFPREKEERPASCVRQPP